MADILRERLRAQHLHRLHCSDGPDLSGVNAAAAANAEIAKQAMDWYQAEYAKTAPDREAASALAMEQAGLQNDLAKQQLKNSQKSEQRYESIFQPVEQKIASDAMAYDTPARREAASAAARADVEQEITGQRQATQRVMARAGVTPSSGRAMALQGMMDIGAAKAKAGAANTARQQVETVGSAKMMDAAGLGRGVVSNQATQAGIALNAGNSAVSNGTQPVNIAGQGAALMGQGFQTATAANNSAGSLYGQAAQIQAQSGSDALWGALGNVAGSVAGAAQKPWIFSDEDMKTDIAPASDDAALAAVRDTPNKVWRYKPASPADDGGKQHVGPMAQKVAASMGMDVAPSGRAIDLVNMNGVTLGAVRALDRRVRRIAAFAGLDLDEEKPRRSRAAAAAGMA